MKLLRQFIKEILTEAAIASSQASKQGLALLISISGDNKAYVLYDPSYFLVSLKERLHERGAFLDILQNVMSEVDGFYGFLETDQETAPCYRSQNVRRSVARQGYGPLMYDIAMSNSSGLAPDRDSVSDAADKVWKYYFNNRTDVEKKSFDDIENPKTPPTYDDCEIYDDENKPELDYSYKSNSKVNISQLQMNHQKMIKDIQRLAPENSKEIEVFIEEFLFSGGEMFFEKKYY